MIIFYNFIQLFKNKSQYHYHFIYIYIYIYIYILSNVVIWLTRHYFYYLIFIIKN
ncbi:MAG: hypothetical protein N7Q72_05465 [Spiroplasma sp. Tabriz.8]|nr:hypothetical protein [Spiroplasma sp. Tabriz.8]